jgi:hypothetical protein
MLEQRRGGRRAFLRTASAAGAVGALGLAGLSKIVTPGIGLRGRKRHADLTADDFSDLVGSRFLVEHEPGRSMAVELIEVNRLKDHGNPKFRKPFSLVFRVPGDTRLPQDVYRVRHRRIGALPALLVPVDLPARSNHLETVFC